MRLDRGRRRTVTIVYRMLPQYRVDFYEGLRARLGKEQIDLQLLYGKNEQNLKKDEVDLNWATSVSHWELTVFGKRLLYQHLPKSIYESSLIILIQENLILSNYLVALRSRRQGVRLALWGHGVNFQDKSDSLGNRWKRLYSSKVDWWFAYTSGVAEHLLELKFPKERITIVNNAIDTRSLIAALALITEEQRRNLRKELNIGEGPVGIYCGGMYPEKRLAFLFQACEAVRREIGNFVLIVVGAGPDSGLAKEFAATHDWVHYVGPKFGLERVPYFSVSHVFLMPGLVGLAVLDSFALQTPIITTKYRFHSPEIEYVENGKNGLISEDDVLAYAQTVVNAIVDPLLLPSLRENGQKSAEKYTIEAMVSSFAEGILNAMHLPPAQ